MEKNDIIYNLRDLLRFYVERTRTFNMSAGTEYDADYFYKANAVELAIKSLNEAYKYRWHDLKKDPSDLPEINEDVLVYDGCGYYVFTLLDHGMQDDVLTWEDSYGYYQDLDEIIAWRYIEPLEDE